MSDRPRIAVIGASRDRRKFGNKCVRAYAQAGWDVFPINPHETEIEGLKTYPSLDGLPDPVDRISVYLPPAQSRTLTTSLMTQPQAQIWFNPGAADAAVLRRAQEMGLDIRDGCSIMDIGLSPAQFN